MAYKESDTVIGYSGLDLFEECYGYNENACFIGDRRAAARPFMEDSLMGSGDFRMVTSKEQDTQTKTRASKSLDQSR